MPKAIDLIKQGRNEDLWQMCCGFLKLDINEFMEIQKHLLLEQLELLNNSTLGLKIMHGARPQSVEEFREHVPLTTYKDYCPELLEKREDGLPMKPLQWVRTSGKSGNYLCKWVPVTERYAEEMSKILFGIGLISQANSWGEGDIDTNDIKILYSVAPRPYISGTFADLLRMQAPIKYLPPLEIAEGLSYEDRVKLGFEKAMSQGLGYFFGLSLVLEKVGDKIRNSSNSVDLRPFLKNPIALLRLGRGKFRSILAGRPMLPKDLWKIKGIIGSGVDSYIYKNKIEEYWGRKPLDIYSCTEGGVIATQAWDYNSMFFTPHLNFLEFIPADEQQKLQMDHNYQPRTLLLNEVHEGQEYELVFSNFHGGSVIRYRIGDIIKITSLHNDILGCDIPQMIFERRADDLINFMVIKLTEKQIWQALEETHVSYEDWVAYKIPGTPVLQLLLEPRDEIDGEKNRIAEIIQKNIINSGRSSYESSGVREDWRDSLDFSVEISLLPKGTFAKYTAQRQSEGADLAHIKPPHVNPPEKVISILLNKSEKETAHISQEERKPVNIHL